MIICNIAFVYFSLCLGSLFHDGVAELYSPAPDDPEYKEILRPPLANNTRFRAKMMAEYMKLFNKTGELLGYRVTPPNVDIIKGFFDDNVTTVTTSTTTSELSLFESILKSPVFVDHTLMMKDLVDKVVTDGKIQLIQAPHGFGKSTNLDMMKRFFQVTVDKADGKKVRNKEESESYRMFTDPKYNLNISKEKEFIRQHLGEYPVIHLDLYKMYEDPAEGLTRRVRQEYDRYNQLCNGQLEKFQLPIVEKPLSVMSYAVYSLGNLARILSEYFNHKVMVFIDNYEDAAMKLIPHQMIIDRIYRVIGVMFFTMMKVLPEYADYIIVTGMTSLGKSYLMARNGLNITTHHFLHTHFATNYYGFTELEAFALFDQYNLTADQRNLIKENCNGYATMNNKTFIYHPVPVRKYLLNTGPNKESELKNYWVLTGPFTPELYRFVRMYEVRAKLMRFLWLGRDHVRVSVDEFWIADITRVQFLYTGRVRSDQGVRMFFSYLLDYGYLGHGGEPHHYIIPNYEIVRELNKLLLRFYTTDLEMRYEQFETLADNLNPILTHVNTTEQMVRNFENALNDFLKPLYKKRLITDGRLYPWPIDEFYTAIFSAAVLKFKHVSGKAPIKHWKQPFVGRTTFGILSDDCKIMLLMEFKYRVDVKSALDRIENHVLVGFPTQVTKYFGVNVDGKFKAEIGTLPNYYSY